MKKKLKVGTNTQTSSLVRTKSPEAIMALKTDLRNHDWQEVYGDDTNQSNDTSPDTFLFFHDRHCPLKEDRQNPKKKENHGFQKGWKKLVKRKILSIRNFSHTEQRIRRTRTKKYKNKLTTIMINCC